jgi:hypothetical protein
MVGSITGAAGRLLLLAFCAAQRGQAGHVGSVGRIYLSQENDYGPIIGNRGVAPDQLAKIRNFRAGCRPADGIA